MKPINQETRAARAWHFNAKVLAATATVGFIFLLSLRGEALAGDGSALVPAPRADLATPPPDDGVAPPPAPAYDGDVPADATAPDPGGSPAAPVMGGGGSSIMVTLKGSSSADSSPTTDADAAGPAASGDSLTSASAPPSDEAARHSHWARVGDSEDDDSGDSSRADAGSDQVLELPQVVDAAQPPQVNAADQQNADAGQGDSADSNTQIGSIDDYQDQVDMAEAYPVPLPMGPVIMNPMMLGSYYGAPRYGYPGFQPPMGGIMPRSAYGSVLPPGPFIIPPGMNTMRSAVLSNSPMLAGSRGAYAHPGGFGRAGGFARFGGFGMGARR
jgi:hypothetical protein